MKQIKDPIYGYIDIDDFCLPLIDTAEFQRLRNIVQTGYQALYPSALHNRFVHSIGVYHLGKKAFEKFEANVKERKYSEYSNTPWDEIKKTFLLACLLHDVGHSPFSHTGEEYYKRSTNFQEELKSRFPNSIDFHEDIKSNIVGTDVNVLSTTSQIGYHQNIGHQDKENPTSLISTIRQSVPEADWAYASSPYGPDGFRGSRVWGDLCHVVSFGNTEQYGVAVPRMLKMFEGMFTDDELAIKLELGNEGEHWEAIDKAISTTGNAYVFKDEYLDSAARRLSGITVQLHGPSFFKPVAPKKELYTDNWTDSYKQWIETYAPADTALTDVFYKVDIIPSAAEYLEDLRNKQMALMAEIIQGTKSADSYIPEFTQLWSKGGGDVMLEEAVAQGEILEAIYKDLGIK